MNEPYLLRTITQQTRKGREGTQPKRRKEKEKEERRKEGNHNQETGRENLVQ